MIHSDSLAVSYLPAGRGWPALSRTFSCCRFGNQLAIVGCCCCCCLLCRVAPDADWLFAWKEPKKKSSCGRLTLVLLVCAFMYYCEMKKKKKKFFFFQSCRSRTHLCDTRPPNVWKRFCFFFSLSKKLFVSIFPPTHFCCCPLFWFFLRSTPSGQKATVHCALTKQLFGHFYFSCIFHAWVFIAKNKLREIKSRNFKSSLVNYLRENSTTETENPSTFLISPVKEKSCPARLISLKDESFSPRLSDVSFFSGFKEIFFSFKKKKTVAK